jgi:hypothetical protein
MKEVVFTLVLIAKRIESSSYLPCLPWNTCWWAVLNFLRGSDFPDFEPRACRAAWLHREPMLLWARLVLYPHDASSLAFRAPYFLRIASKDVGVLTVETRTRSRYSMEGHFEAHVKLVIDHIYNLSAAITHRQLGSRQWSARVGALHALHHLDTPECPISWMLLRPPWVSARSVKALAVRSLEGVRTPNAGVMYSVAKLWSLGEKASVASAANKLLQAAELGCSDAIADLQRRSKTDPNIPPLHALIAMVKNPNWNVIATVCHAHIDAVNDDILPSLAEANAFESDEVRLAFCAQVVAAEIANDPTTDVTLMGSLNKCTTDHHRSDPHYQLYVDGASRSRVPTMERFGLAAGQQCVSFRKRELLIDWMLDVLTEMHGLAKVNHECTLRTIHMAVGLVDVFMCSSVATPRSCFQLVGAACLVVASRYQSNSQPLSMRTAVYYASGAFEYAELAVAIGELVIVTKGRLRRTTSLDFFQMFHPFVDEGTADLAETILTLALVSRSTVFESHAITASAALYLAAILHAISSAENERGDAEVTQSFSEMLPNLEWAGLASLDVKPATFALYALCFAGQAYGTPDWTWLPPGHYSNERSVFSLSESDIVEMMPEISTLGFEAVARAIYSGGRPTTHSDVTAFRRYFTGYDCAAWEVLQTDTDLMDFLGDIMTANPCAGDGCE